nr:hypothetical protein [Bacillota bacterium]
MARSTRPFEQFFAYRRYFTSLAMAPRGDRVAYVTDASGQFNLWIQPWEGGWPSQRTAFEEQSVREIAWSPVEDRIIFLADRHVPPPARRAAGQPGVAGDTPLGCGGGGAQPGWAGGRLGGERERGEPPLRPAPGRRGPGRGGLAGRPGGGGAHARGRGDRGPGPLR